MLRRTLFLILLTAVVVLAARVGEQYAWQLDLSARQINSLSTSATRALDALPERLEMTAFVPDLPVQRVQLERLLAPYLAHSDKVRLTIVDPVREPDRARAAGAAKHGELQLRPGPRLEVVATPSAPAIDRALNRLALRGERWIVSLKGHGETAIDETPTGMGRFVRHAESLGYRFVTVDPRHIDNLPENAGILLIAGPRRDYDARTLEQIRRFLARGGALLWLTDRPLPDFLAGETGVEPLPGILVDAAAASHGLDSPDNAIVSDYPASLIPQRPAQHSVLKRSRALRYREGRQWRLVGRLQSSPRSWNETGDLRGTLARNPGQGEQAGPLSVGVALERTGSDPAQRMAIIGSRHFVGNDQLGLADNRALAVGLLHWLSDNEQLSSEPIATDLDIRWQPRLATLLAAGLMGVLPAVYLVAGLLLRGRRRRA